MSRWMLSKLALREGDLDAAVEHLQAATELFPSPEAALFADYPVNASCPHHDHHPVKAAHIELGILLVAVDRPSEALQAFLQGGDWLDAAWVAERLLSTQELIEFVERWFPERQPTSLNGNHGAVHDLLDGQDLPASQVPASTRHLLARRLAREGRWPEALPYFPLEVSWDASRVAEGLRRGEDPSLSEDERGTAKWEAAFRMKQSGWELLATEMEPDFRVLRGWYQGADTRGLRLGEPDEEPASWLTEDEVLAQRVLHPSAAERSRLEAHGPPNEHRYHFVWTAHDLAWEAVNLMADDNPALEQALCTGGAWQRNRDPASAQRFLDQLQTRRPESALARGRFEPLTEEGLCAVVSPPERAGGCASGPRSAGWLALLLAGLGVVLRRHAAAA